MELNADFSRRAVVHAASLAWTPSPINGVERRMLDRMGGEVARATSIVRYALRSRFLRKDGKFFVETDGPDGQLATFEVKFTFGLDPLQQYLIEFPDGRLQALSIAWDSRPKQQGGQRWFHLYPDEEIRHDDVLH